MTFFNEWEEELKPLGSKRKPLNQKDREIVYAAAFGLYEGGDYEQSSLFFTKLVLEDPFEIRFWKGLASSHQMLRNYQEALHAWGIVCILGNHDSIAHFHAAECYLSMNELQEAKKALQCAEKSLTEKSSLFEKIQLLKLRIDTDGKN